MPKPTKKPTNQTKLDSKPKGLGAFLPWILIGSGIIGLVSSFIISLDKIKLIENSHYQPSCDLNPIISCGSVMNSPQGSVFGFSNPWIGLAAFAVLITLGVALLAGAKFARWFWIGLEIGVILGLIFALWLLYESVYSINALCPYCLATDIAVITTFWYVSLYLIQEKMLTLPKSWGGTISFVRKHHLDILILIFLVIIIIILKHFWYYYGQHL